MRSSFFIGELSTLPSSVLFQGLEKSGNILRKSSILHQRKIAFAFRVIKSFSKFFAYLPFSYHFFC